MRPATLILLVLLCGVAHADEKPSVWIASGESGGTYRDVYAKNFEMNLRSYKVFHRKTTGSGENLELLVSDKADVSGFEGAESGECACVVCITEASPPIAKYVLQHVNTPSQLERLSPFYLRPGAKTTDRVGSTIGC